MEITEVKVRLRDREGNKLKAYATVIFDDSFVVRDLKIIDGRKGLFVAMPSRQVREACPNCHHRNALRSRFCNQCGKALEFQSVLRKEGEDNRVDEHRDVAHPITTEARDYLQKKVLEAYEAERAELPQEVKPEIEPEVEQPISTEPGIEQSSENIEQQSEDTPEQSPEIEPNTGQTEKTE
ncbi:MAG: septation protein SpoVG family protein [bacterium]